VTKIGGCGCMSDCSLNVVGYFLFVNKDSCLAIRGIFCGQRVATVYDGLYTCEHAIVMLRLLCVFFCELVGFICAELL
jgi:hypothetical protein